MTEERSMEDDLRRRAERGPRPDPTKLFRDAAGRADELRRRRRVGLVVLVLVVAVVAISVAATRRRDVGGVSTIGPLATSASTSVSAVPSPTTMSTDVAGVKRTGGVMVDDGGDLVVVDPDSGARTLVLTGITGSWAPDREELAGGTSSSAFDDGLSVLTLDASRRVQIYSSAAAPPSDPTWSPDGRRLAFTVPANNPDTIMVIERDGTGLHQVGKGRYPAWSADGRQIYANTLGDDVQIQRMDADGSTVQVLALGPGQHGYPAPGATSLAYADFATHGISVSDLDGTRPHPVTTCDAQACDDHTPRWSPDGTRLAFIRTTGGGSVSTLVIATAATGEVLGQHDATDPRRLFLLSWR